MSVAVRISTELIQEAQKFSKIDHRSVTNQIEHWARIGKCSEENPDLSYNIIKELLLGSEELKSGNYSVMTADEHMKELGYAEADYK